MSPSTLQVPLYYDFSSTLCYVADRVMHRMRADLEVLDLELLWTPIDLTLLTPWKRGDRMRVEQRRNVLRVSRELGVPLLPPSRWMDSRPAMAVAMALHDRPSEAARWRREVWRWTYEGGRSLDEPGALDALARSALVDPETLASRDSPRAVVEETHRAIHAGIHGVPTFLLDIWPIGGIQEESTMHSLLSRWAERRRDQEREHDSSRPN